MLIHCVNINCMNYFVLLGKDNKNDIFSQYRQLHVRVAIRAEI